MTVIATCTNCDDQHPLADRPFDEMTTHCPACGAATYQSSSDTETIDDGAVVAALEQTNGIGNTTLEEISEEFAKPSHILFADEDRLQKVEGVGPTTAQRVRDNVIHAL